MKWLSVCTLLITLTARAPAQQITLKDSTHGFLRVDSISGNDAWVELDAASPDEQPLDTSDIIIRDRRGVALIISVDSIGERFRSHLALSFVLDNSGSMFHAFDSLTRYCDSLIDSLAQGVIAQAVVFDTRARTASHEYTRRGSTFIAQSGWLGDKSRLSRYWHFYDTIRTQFTPLYDAIAAAMQNVEERREQPSDSERVDVLLVITDGQDNASRASIETVHDLLSDNHVRFIAINFRSDPDLRLSWLARHENGAFYVASDLADLRSLLHQIALSVTRAYHIRYVFPAPSPLGPH